MTDNFCHPHCHSSYSFLDGLPPPSALAKRAAELGQPGLALTEHGHMFSVPQFATACKEHGIKALHGAELYEAVPHTWDTDPDGPHHGLFKGKWDKEKPPRYHHLTIWVANEQGWKNLCAIQTQSFTAGFKPKNQPLVDRATLERHNEGLIIGLGCPQSRTNVALERLGYQAAIKAAEWYFEVFPGRVYVEVMSALPEQIKALSDQRRLAKHFGAKCLGSNDVHYLTRPDGEFGAAHHMLVMARKFKSTDTETAQSEDKSDEASGSYYGAPEFYLKSRQELLQAGLFAPELDTSLELMDRIEFSFGAIPKPKPPQAQIPEVGEDPAFEAYLSLDTR